MNPGLSGAISSTDQTRRQEVKFYILTLACDIANCPQVLWSVHVNLARFREAFKSPVIQDFKIWSCTYQRPASTFLQKQDKLTSIPCLTYTLGEFAPSSILPHSPSSCRKLHIPLQSLRPGMELHWFISEAGLIGFISLSQRKIKALNLS